VEKLHNEKFHDMFSSPTIVWVIKSERMITCGACIVYGKGEVCTGLRRKNLRERDHWGDLVVDGRILLMRIFRK
jgi:hypothetical protein